MIIDINEKFGGSQNGMKSRLDRWHERFCLLLYVYKGRDEDGTKQITERMIAVGDGKELVRKAMMEGLER